MNKINIKTVVCKMTEKRVTVGYEGFNAINPHEISSGQSDTGKCIFARKYNQTFNLLILQLRLACLCKC